MEWVITYIVGVVVCAVVLGFFDRGRDSEAAWIVSLWWPVLTPLVAAYFLLQGPFLLGKKIRKALTHD